MRRGPLFSDARTPVFQHTAAGVMPPIATPVVGQPTPEPMHLDSLRPRILSPRVNTPSSLAGPQPYPDTANRTMMMPITAGASSTNTPKVFDDGVRFPRYREQMYGDDWTRATRVPVANEVGTSPRSRLRAFKDSAGHVIYQKPWGAFDERFSRADDALWDASYTHKAPTTTLKLDAPAPGSELHIRYRPQWNAGLEV